MRHPRNVFERKFSLYSKLLRASSGRDKIMANEMHTHRN